MLSQTQKQLNHAVGPSAQRLAFRLRAGANQRSVRIVALLAGVVLLSMFDLAMTLDQMRSTGMAEGNPLIVHLVRHTQSAAVVGLYKVMTVAVSVSVLFRLRRHMQAEIAAWCSLAVLCALTLQWMRYSDYVARLGPTMMAQMSELESGWTVLR